MSSDPNIEIIEEVFFLHALLQMKQVELEEQVLVATGSNTRQLKELEGNVLISCKKIESLVFELDKILSNPVYEKFCDFSLVNATAQENTQDAMHLVVNDLDSTSVKVNVDESIFSSLDNLVTVSSQTPTKSRFELVPLEM
ncbi:hypothetical protein EB796_009461 [Bugula neritina]|uniref:Uncharacterized protein n=1 Tax=Bugula neritina TaxID=10212 RepID=A0A7J7K0U5_BUGNE|nr:hypothetical protein EB796_009461 [Bugula neritina]